jgi:hypothetical protein
VKSVVDTVKTDFDDEIDPATKAGNFAIVPLFVVLLIMSDSVPYSVALAREREVVNQVRNARVCVCVCVCVCV